jgi:hypothetical protein
LYVPVEGDCQETGDTLWVMHWSFISIDIYSP